MIYVLGIDIGGTSVKLGVVAVGAKATILEQTSIKTRTDHSADTIVRRIADAGRELIAQTGVDVVGIGVGCPGIIDPESGTVIKSPNIKPLDGYPVQRVLHERLERDVEIQNDASAAVLGEFLFGPNSEVRNLILLTMGTGLGGGVIADGRLLHGADNAAAELGHLCIHRDGEECQCGQKGCLEAYVGRDGIKRIARKVLANRRDSMLSPERLDTKLICEAAVAGDPIATDVLREVGHHLGIGISMMINSFNPEKIIIGGGASPAFGFLEPGINEALRNASFPALRDRVKIEPAAFRNEINLLGAAATYLNAQPSLKRDLARIRVMSSKQYVLGVHIGASSQHVGLLDRTGNVIAKDDWQGAPESRQDKSYQSLIEDAVDGIESVIDKAASQGITPDQILGGGLIVPAPVDSERGRVFTAPSLTNLQDVPAADDLRVELRRRTGIELPIRVENDANGYCLAERYFGAAVGLDDFIVLLVCTGVGGAILVNGELYHGHDQMAGEFGHVTVAPRGRFCRCGNQGCLETVVSGGALLEQAKRPESHYLDLVDAANRGDQKVKRLFDSMGKFLGIGVAMLVTMLNPAKVVICGEFAKAHELFEHSMNREINQRVFPGMTRNVEVSKQTSDCQVRAGMSVFVHYQLARSES